MGRQEAKTLEFIRIDVVDKTTVKRLFRKYGKDGRLFWWELLRLLARTENYFLDLSDEWNLEDTFEEELFVDKTLGIKIVDQLCKWGNIDTHLWVNYKIIWCEGLIEKHIEVFKKRKKIPQKPLNNCISDAEIGISVTENGVSDAESTQSKVKESKVKERSKYHSGKNPGKEKKETTKFWKDYVAAWFEFYQKHFQSKPTFRAADAKNLKFIVTQLEKISVSPDNNWTQEYALKVYHHFLNKAIADSWLKSNFLLTNLATKFDSIINKPKSKKTTSEVVHVNEEKYG